VISADIVGAVCDHATELVALISARREFSAYGSSHWAVLAVFAIASGALVWIGRRQSESQARLLGRVLGAVTAVYTVRDWSIHCSGPPSPVRFRCA
jgi:hypothetical protein